VIRASRDFTANRTKQEVVVGKPVGTVGTAGAPVHHETVADLERTTGFEPATLTLAKLTEINRRVRPGALT
jgi:hypothetical protein